MDVEHRIWCDWDQSALDRAVGHLLPADGGAPDLRDRLLIVPTRQAGRRLRERLALAAARRQTAVLIGPVETPAALFQPPPDPAPVATDIAAEAFWRATLTDAPADMLAALGAAAAGRDPLVRAAAAGHLRVLRDTLCEEGHSLASFAARHARAGLPETARWQALAALESLYLERLRVQGWRDDTAAKLAAAAAPRLPSGIARVVLLCLPDPPPLALRALERLAECVPVDVVVHAPAALASAFDAWGRPDPEIWSSRPLSLAPADVEICDDGASVAERIRRIVVESPPPDRANLAVGVADPATATRITQALARDGVTTFDPAGLPAARLSLFNLADRLLEFRNERRFERLLALLRHPHALRRLERALGMEHHLLTLLDDFQQKHMPVDLAAARALAPHCQHEQQDAAEGRRRCAALEQALDAVAAWLADLDAADPAAGLLAVLGQIYEGFPADARLIAEAALLRAALARFGPVRHLCADRAEAEDLLRRALAGAVLTTARRDDDLELPGWLELAWEDSPVLLLADLNDGVIPETLAPDPFLPDGLRAGLGLRDNRRRYARDAYLLECLVRSRATGGLRAFMARRGANGDLLKPSRLLLQGPPEELAIRALRVFADGPPVFASVERVPGWRLSGPDPAVAAATDRLSVSKIITYLECPFLFYLRHVVRIRDPWRPSGELDARAFGTLVHEVFEDFARGADADTADAGVIERCLLAALDHRYQARYGARPALPLVIQRDILRQRLAYAARCQAEWRRQGWRIRADLIECAVTIAAGPGVVTARIDRLDYNERTGEWCVMDYKTRAQAETPDRAHLVKCKTPDPAFAAGPDGASVWTDLQLPLYALAARDVGAPADRPVRAAYFVLPNAVTDTAILTWDGFDDGLAAAARDCAAAVFRRVRAGVFWPPRRAYVESEPEYPLFIDGIERNLEPAFIERLAAAAGAEGT